MSKAPRPRLLSAPEIERLTLAMVNGVPPSHPEHASFRRFPVYGWVIRHPDGPRRRCTARWAWGFTSRRRRG